VLHKGRALAKGSAGEIIAAQGAAGIGEAFERLTFEKTLTERS